MQRAGFAFLGVPDVPQMVGLAQQAEQLGYDSAWVAETRFTRDALVPCAAIAQATSRIGIATGVVNVYTRGAALLGVSFATLDELSGGRAIIGVGPGSPKILAAQGYGFEGALRRMREYVACLRQLFERGAVDHQGEYVQAQLQLEFPPERQPPIILGVTGPRALEVAGEVADGVIFNGFLPEAYYERAAEHLEAGRQRGNLAGKDFQRIAFVVASVDEDGTRARDRVRPLVATYLVTFPNIARETGYPTEGVEALDAAFAKGGPEGAARLLSDEWVDALTVAGTPEECRKTITRYQDWGVDFPVLAPVANADLTLETFAPTATSTS